MAEVLRVFEEPVRDPTGEYRARVVGRPAADGMWEGWIEFTPLTPNDTDVLASAVESRQPEREHLEYWAGGLTQVYAEGALARASSDHRADARRGDSGDRRPGATRDFASARAAVYP